MIKKLLFLLLLVALVSPAMAQQSGKKLTADEAARKTPDQRFVYESERKSKKKNKKKKQLSTKKKVRIQEKQEAKVRKKKDPKRKR
jgi:hypothetical protein